MSDSVIRQGYGRRKDDPKSILSHRGVRKALVILGATGSLAWFVGPFFVWWLSTQYAEKTKALDDIQSLHTDVTNLKIEINHLKTSDQLLHENLVRIEDKVDIILLNIEGLSKKLSTARKTSMATDKNNTLLCRDGWDVWVPTTQLEDFRKKNPSATIGGCD